MVVRHSSLAGRQECSTPSVDRQEKSGESYSGTSLSNTLGTILGGAVAPVQSGLTLRGHRFVHGIGVYLTAMASISWGAPRIHGELRKLGLAASQSTVAKYMRRHPRPPSQTWRTFLTNHAGQIMAADLFVVPTVTFRLLFVLVILAHDRRRIIHADVTAHPTAGWVAQQLRNAFPEHEAPRYLVHDRDGAFAAVTTTLAGMRIEAVRTAPRSPWQNAYVERLIGSIRRECLDHVVVGSEVGLRRMLASYVAYYMRSRTHLALAKDSPLPRAVHAASSGRIVATPEIGGLHHRYERAAA